VRIAKQMTRGNVPNCHQLSRRWNQPISWEMSRMPELPNSGAWTVWIGTFTDFFKFVQVDPTSQIGTVEQLAEQLGGNIKAARSSNSSMPTWHSHSYWKVIQYHQRTIHFHYHHDELFIVEGSLKLLSRCSGCSQTVPCTIQKLEMDDPRYLENPVNVPDVLKIILSVSNFNFVVEDRETKKKKKEKERKERRQLAKMKHRSNSKAKCWKQRRPI